MWNAVGTYLLPYGSSCLPIVCSNNTQAMINMIDDTCLIIVFNNPYIKQDHSQGDRSIRDAAMRTYRLCLWLILVILALSCISSNGRHVSARSSDISNIQNMEPLRRQKRQFYKISNGEEDTLDLDDDDQESPTFWDVMKASTTLLMSRFMPAFY